MSGEIEGELRRGINFIATGDPAYLYGVREDRRELAEMIASDFIGEDLSASMGESLEYNGY